MLALGGSLAVSLPTLAQDNTSVQRIEITGSAIKRIDAENALPVTVVSRKDIDQMGVTSTDQLLANITATSFAGASTVSEGAGLSTYGLSSVSLRGLGSNRTLVLVNGRRLANYATDGTTVDINSIPLSAVERVEVLRDGASSIYGSDAVAGVINFILRTNYRGVEASAYAGTPSRSGGGQTYKVGLVGGFGNLDSDRYNVLMSFDYTQDKALYGRDRKFADHAWDDNGLYDISATPSGALTGPWDTTVNLAGDQPNFHGLGNPLAPDNCAKNGSGFDPNIGTCRFNPSPFVPLVPDDKRYTLAGNATFQLNDNTSLFAEAFYTRTDTNTTEQPSPFSAAFLSTDNAFVGTNIPQALLLMPGNPNYPAAYLAGTPADGKPVSVSYRSFDAGARIHEDIADQIHAAAGVKGSFGNWDYDLVASTNNSKVKESTLGGYELQTKLVQILNSIPDWDPYSQYQTPAIADQIRQSVFNGEMVTSKLTTNGIDGKIGTSFGSLPGGQIDASIGFSARREHMDFEPSAAYRSGDVSGYGGQALPIDKSRNVEGVFGEMELPLLKSLSADVSVRTDHYPGRSTTNPKGSFRWQPTKELLVRGSVGTGFRAPSLPELYQPNTLGTTNTFLDPVSKTNGQFNETLGGNPNLKPEKSKQYGLGIVLEPTKDLSAGVDFFHININDTIQALEAQFIVQQAAANNPAYTGLVTRDASGNITNILATNQNAGSTTAEGWDLDMKWRAARLAWGNLDFALNGTYMSKYDVVLPDGTVQHCIASTVDASGNLLSCSPNSVGVVMRWRHAATVSLNNSTWGGSFTQNYQTGYGDNTDTNGNPHYVDAYTTLDAEVHYTGIKDLRLALGVKNLFDRDPPTAITSQSYFQTGYDPTYYDARARFVYLTANYKFK
jgi:iron complex outermembrane receptor protein